MKQISVRPVSANLTRDTELIGKMVSSLLSRILIVFVLLEMKNKKPNILMRLEKTLNGMMNYCFITKKLLPL
jgi:hypothetical protein